MNGAHEGVRRIHARRKRKAIDIGRKNPRHPGARTGELRDREALKGRRHSREHRIPVEGVDAQIRRLERADVVGVRPDTVLGIVRKRRGREGIGKPTVRHRIGSLGNVDAEGISGEIEFLHQPAVRKVVVLDNGVPVAILAGGGAAGPQGRKEGRRNEIHAGFVPNGEPRSVDHADVVIGPYGSHRIRGIGIPGRMGLHRQGEAALEGGGTFLGHRIEPALHLGRGAILGDPFRNDLNGISRLPDRCRLEGSEVHIEMKRYDGVTDVDTVRQSPAAILGQGWSREAEDEQENPGFPKVHEMPPEID